MSVNWSRLSVSVSQDLARGGADASLVGLIPDAEAFGLLEAEERRLDLRLAALPLRRESPAVDFRVELLKLKRRAAQFEVQRVTRLPSL